MTARRRSLAKDSFIGFRVSGFGVRGSGFGFRVRGKTFLSFTRYPSPDTRNPSLSSQSNLRLGRDVIGDDNFRITMCPQEARRGRRRDRAVQHAAHDGALPRAVAIEPQLFRRQTFLHSDSYGTARDEGDLAANGNAVDRARLARQAKRSRREFGERVVADF